jgi:hypothetical protein
VDVSVWRGIVGARRRSEVVPVSGGGKNDKTCKFRVTDRDRRSSNKIWNSGWGIVVRQISETIAYKQPEADSPLGVNGSQIFCGFIET